MWCGKGTGEEDSHSIPTVTQQWKCMYGVNHTMLGLIRKIGNDWGCVTKHSREKKLNYWRRSKRRKDSI